MTGRRLALGMAAVAAAAVAAMTPAQARSEREPRERGGPAHVFVIMMENHAYDEIIGNTADAPFANRLVRHAGLATNYFGVTHPSLPNYLSTISGDFQGIWDDCKAGAAITCAPEEFVPGKPNCVSKAARSLAMVGA